MLCHAMPCPMALPWRVLALLARALSEGGGCTKNGLTVREIANSGHSQAGRTYRKRCSRCRNTAVGSLQLQRGRFVYYTVYTLAQIGSGVSGSLSSRRARPLERAIPGGGSSAPVVGTFGKGESVSRSAVDIESGNRSPAPSAPPAPPLGCEWVTRTPGSGLTDSPVCRLPPPKAHQNG